MSHAAQALESLLDRTERLDRLFNSVCRLVLVGSALFFAARLLAWAAVGFGVVGVRG